MCFRRISDNEERAILERAEELLARGVGIPQPENFFSADSEDDFMGAIKIKDGLFIGDEFAAQVGYNFWTFFKSLSKSSLLTIFLIVCLIRTWSSSPRIK